MANLPTNEAVLYLVQGGEVQFDIAFPLPSNSEITIGRDPNCDIPLDSYTSVSRHHGKIRPLKGESGEWVFYDLNSSNGTFINAKKIQGGQVLKAGDIIKIASDGPEFLFEYERLNLTKITKQIKKKLVIQRYEKINKPNYSLETTPTKLIITLPMKNAMKNGASTFWYIFFLVVFVFPIIIGLWVVFNVIFSSLMLVIINSLLLLTLLFLICIGDFFPTLLGYAFDLETGNFIIRRSRGFMGWLFNQYRHNEVLYPLREFTAVRLEKSIYEGDEGTKYDTYSIFLERETGKAFQLPFYWHNNPEDAHELVELIEMYLEQVED